MTFRTIAALSLLVIPSVNAATWYLLVSGSSQFYESSICRMKQLLLSQLVPSDNIITFSSSIPESSKTYDDQFQPATECESDYVSTDDDPVNSAFFLNVLKDLHDAGLAAPKKIQSTASDDVFMYFASHSGYDQISLPSGVLYGKDLWDVLSSTAFKFRSTRIFVDGSVYGNTFLRDEITAANAGWSVGSLTGKNIRVVSSNTGGDKTALNNSKIGVLCNCPPSHSKCMTTRFGMAFTETAGANFSDHLTAVKALHTSLNGSISEVEYGIWPENLNGNWNSNCAGANTSACPATFYTNFPWHGANLIQLSGAAYDDDTCSTFALDGKLSEVYFSYIQNSGLSYLTLEEWINKRNRFKELVNLFFTTATPILKSASAAPGADTFMATLQSVCTGINGASCKEDISLSSQIGATTTAQTTCVKEVFTELERYFSIDGGYLQSEFSVPANHICASTSFQTAGSNNRVNLRKHLNETFCDCPPVIEEKKTTYYKITFAFGIAGVSATALMYVLLVIFDKKKGVVAEMTDKQRAKQATNKLLNR